jgi:hypothetical protein
MRWWFHRDRLTDQLNGIEASGARHLRCEESVVDGTRTRVIHYMDRKSWTHHNVTGTPVLPTGIAERSGDRFVLPYSAVRTYTSPLGGKLISTCECRTEFIPQASGTEIVAVHNHTVSGMSKRRQWSRGEAERTRDETGFQELLDRCRLPVS